MADVGWLFVDLNSYFASIEQELRPELRGQPIGIVPIEAKTACCIALSYQAKAYGIKTGVRADEALERCPHIQIVQARPRLYVEYHHRIVEAIERAIPIHTIMSCDEFAAQLMGKECELERATSIAYQVKDEIRRVGRTLRCSIGIAPNRLLAKVAGDLMKPDGLFIYKRRNLPQALFPLQLGDIPGIGPRIEERIRRAGINTMRELCSLPREQMSALWGNVWGDRLWLWLRGEDFLEPEPRPLQTLSRQHILPPDCRTRDKVRGIVLKLLHSTAKKMRAYELWAGGVALQISFYDGPTFSGGARIAPCNDTHTLQEHMLVLFDRTPDRRDTNCVSVCLTHLDAEPSLSLFAPPPDAKRKLTPALDGLNTRYGRHTVYLGSIHNVRGHAPTRIPFGPPPPLNEFDDPADNVKKPVDRYRLPDDRKGHSKNHAP